MAMDLDYIKYKIRMVTRPQTISNNGITIRIPEGAHPDLVKLIYRNRFEAAEVELLGKTVIRGDVILDVGSGLGLTSVLAAKLSGNKVTAVEANPELVPAITRNANANGVDIEVVNAAVTTENGTADFYIENRFFASSLKATDTAKHIRIAAIGIRTLLERYRPTYLTMDIEGAEFELLPLLTKDDLRAIAVETHAPGRVPELIATMREKGFDCSEELSTGAQLYFY